MGEGWRVDGDGCGCLGGCNSIEVPRGESSLPRRFGDCQANLKFNEHVKNEVHSEQPLFCAKFGSMCSLLG